MKLVLHRIPGLLLALSLQACGGGGGGNDAGGGGNPPPPPPGSGLVALSRFNAEPVGILSFGPTDNALYAMQLVMDAAHILHQESLTQQNFSCTGGGSVQLDATDRDNSGQLSAGDRVVISYSSCGGTTDGPLTLDITAIAFNFGQILSLDGRFTIDLDFIDPPPATLAGGGNLAFRATSSELSWLGTGVSVSLTSSGRTEAYTGGRVEKILTASGAGLSYAVTLSGTIDSDSLDGRFTFSTQPAFTGTEGWWPDAGRLTATGRNNSQLTYRTLNVQQAVAGYEVDADGNGVVDDLPTAIDWDEIALGAMFGVSGDPDIQPPPNPGPNILGRRILLGAPGEDLVTDVPRNRFYVTVPDRHELLVFSAVTLEVLQRIHLTSRPNGLSMSADGEEILVGLSASGSVAAVDADTFAISTYYAAPDLQSARVFNVVETGPGILYAGTSVPNDFGRVGRIDRATGAVTPITSSAQNYGEIELAADPVGGFLYAGNGRGGGTVSLFKYDATSPQTPLLLSKTDLPSHGASRLTLDATGARLYTYSGDVLDTSNFAQIGRISFGTPAVSPDGTEVLVGLFDGGVSIHSTASLRETGTLRTDCAFDQEFGEFIADIDRIAPSPVSGQWLLLGGEVLCAIDRDDPTLPPGTGQPGVQPAPLPVTNVMGVRVQVPGGSTNSFEFDEARNRVYVSVPSSGEVVTIDAATHQVIERDVLGNAPRGLDLSPDGSTLAIMFNGNGHIGFKDLATGLTEMRDLTALLGSTAGSDVAWLSNDTLLASAAPNCCGTGAYIVQVSRPDPGASRRLGTGASSGSQALLTLSPDRNFLYTVGSDARMTRFDLGQPNAPAVAMSEDAYSSAARPAPSPDGERLAFSTGVVLRSSDLYQAAETRAGAVTYSPDGASLYQALGGTIIDRFDTANYRATQRYTSGCLSGPNHLLTNAAGNRIFALAQTNVCFWTLDQPVMSTMRVGPQDPQSCGASCLLGRYQEHSGSLNRGWRTVRLPTASH